MSEKLTIDMSDKVCLVTGANSGIGKAIATGLARMGATVVIVCRHAGRGEKARRQIVERTGCGNVELLLADLSIQQSIHDLAATFRSRYSRLDVLVNNAAILTRTRRVTADGLEMQFAVNHLAYFLLTHLLLDVLKQSAPSRIVNLASTAHSRGRLDFDDLQGERDYQGWQTYANTKLANIVFTYELARRLEGTGVTANCVHPGVIYTGLMRHFSTIVSVFWTLLQAFFKKPEEGADTPLYLASSPEVRDVSGRYFKYRAPLGTSAVSNDREVQRRLWEASESLTGVQSAV
jgi:NAD(P)-dependent dehydrogenase (short-subunit alcohol dehydrogenase family)